LRLAWALFLLALSSPCWVVALVLVPVYLLERLCMRAAWGSMDRLRRASTVVEVLKREPLEAARDRYFAKSRNARRARKVVRPC